MSLNGDKLLCSLYIKEIGGRNFHAAYTEYITLSTLKIYSNKILVLDKIGNTVSSTSYYKSTITEEDLNIILNLCESNVLPPYLKQCMAKIPILFIMNITTIQ